MILAAEHNDMRKVGIVDMCINSEKSFEDNFNNLCEIFRETNTYWEFFISQFLPTVDGKILSLFNWFSTHVIRYSIYSAADTFKGVLTFVPSAQRYSYLGPADITGQDSAVQNSMSIPYKRLTILEKKYLKILYCHCKIRLYLLQTIR